MASVSFVPKGSQIDQDPIKDIQLDVGETLEAELILDTTGLDANLRSLDFRVDQDVAETVLDSARTDGDIAAFPEFNFTVTAQGDDIFSSFDERDGTVGIEPNQKITLVEANVTALSEVKNDGKPDYVLTVVNAIDANGKDVTSLFQPSSQEVEIQPFPKVGVSVDKTLPLSEFNEDSGTFIINLSEPAPIGGLLVNFFPVDSDGVPGDVIPSTINGTLQIGETGSPNGILIDEGKTEAKITLTAVKDDIAEGEEISGLDILPGESYTIDQGNNSSLFVVTDSPIVTFSVDKTIISEGGEPQLYTFQLNEPAPDGGLTVRLELEDPDNDLSDGGFPSELFKNIDNSDFVIEDGKLIVKFTIASGATSANFGFATGEDNKVEGDENYSLTLLKDDSYSIDLDPTSTTITTTITEKPLIEGTNGSEKLFGTNNSEFIVGFGGDDTIYGNGGEDTLIGDEGNDVIYGGSQADKILAGEGDDIIYGNGGEDLIDSGTGLDTVWLGSGKATVTLETGEGFDTVKNFQLGATRFKVESTDNLSFADSYDGTKIFQGDDLIAVVTWQNADNFIQNQNSIFVG